MTARLDYPAVAPEAVQAIAGVEKYVRSTSLGYPLLELIKLRASQINGCAFCVDMHTRELRELGEDQSRIDMLIVWREAQCYSDRERAALAWTEAVTLLAESGVPDAVFAEASEHFEPRELVDLTVAIATINAWNRLAVSFRAVPGGERPSRKPSQTVGATV